MKKSFYLVDGGEWQNLWPLTYTRSVADIRIGILTIREKWNLLLQDHVEIIAQDYLQAFYPYNLASEPAVFINSAVIPTTDLVDRITQLKNGESLVANGNFIAGMGSFDQLKQNSLVPSQWNNDVQRISFPWHIFQLNAQALELDFEFITKGRRSVPLSATNTLLPFSNSRIFLEEGAKMEACILNSSSGPIYIGKNAEVMEGSVIRGGLALGDNAQLKMATKIYGATTIGPNCKIGGEVNNSVIFGNSNKAHDGFLGNSVIGEWCNLGADTNNSNLKNNYGDVSCFSLAKEEMLNTQTQFCGLFMGDHSKSGINTMFNTGTVVGVNANVFGSGFPPKHIPSFVWGGAEGFEEYRLEKSFEVSEKVMERRNVKFSDRDREIMRHIYNITKKFRP